MVDASTGEELGTHEGVHGFTIGQRKGLGLERPAPDGKPRYVTSIDAESGTVTVGGSEYLTVDGLIADRPYWLTADDIRELDCEVQVRAHGNVVPAHLVRTDGEHGEEFHLELREPLRGVAPGQAAVIYRPDAQRGDRVLGSATIRETRSVAVSA